MFRLELKGAKEVDKPDVDNGVLPMVGCKDAIDWVTTLAPDGEKKERVLKRMKYEFAKDIPVKPKFHPGKYGHKYDNWTCGNCGFGLSEVVYHFCPNCGFAIGKRTEY